MKVSKSLVHLGEKEGDQSESMGGKGELHSQERQVPRRKEMAYKESLLMKSRRNHERMQKFSQEDLERLGLIPSLAKPEMEKKAGRQRVSHKMTTSNESW